MRASGEGPDAVIARLAGRQYGVVSVRQLRAAGVGDAAIATRVKRSRLHRLHRGVYAVGHTALAPGAREMAAVLACGPGAAVSHRSAAVMLGLLKDDGGPVEVTVAGSARSRPGLVVHRSRTLRAKDVRPIRGIPATTPERALVDMAETARDRDLERAVDEALTRRLTSRPSLAAAVQRAQGRKGTHRLGRLLQRNEPTSITRSEAEERFLALVREAQLDPPEVNVALEGLEVDFLWRRSRLVAEVDGYRFHSTRAAFERDRVRDAGLNAVNYRVMRVTWLQMEEEPLAVIARLAGALAVGGASPPPTA